MGTGDGRRPPWWSRAGLRRWPNLALLYALLIVAIGFVALYWAPPPFGLVAFFACIPLVQLMIRLRLRSVGGASPTAPGDGA
jgi:hypothetical protein